MWQMIFLQYSRSGRGGSLLRRLCAALALIVTALMTACPLDARAQTIDGYAVEIIGAGQFAPMLDEFLDIRRHAADRDMTLTELQRLAAAAAQQIRALLATEGYFSPRVQQDLLAGSGRPLARFEIDLGPPTLVDEVEIHFVGAIASAEGSDLPRMTRLRQQWSLAAGSAFRQADWDEAKATLLKDLLAHDYPAARLQQSEARVDPERRTATLTIEVDSGPAFTFGALQIAGLKRYPRQRIDALNPIYPGEPYSQSRLNELQARLQDSGYFKSVFATIDVDPTHPVAVPIRLDLSENERRKLSLGGGFSTDTGARLQVKFFDRNFLQRDWRLDSELRLDQKTRLAAVQIALPPQSNGWLPSFGARFERTDIASEVSDKLRLDARLTSPDQNNQPAVGMAYLAERQHVADAGSSHRHALIATSMYTRRRVDNLLSPQRGYVASLELDAGVRGLLTEQSLARFVGRVTWLQPWSPQWKTVLRAQVGQVFGARRSTVPGDLLFRTGGDQTVRGYGFESLGVADGDAVVGGRVLAVLSAELVYQITPQWGAAVFNDAGNAADAWRDFRFAVGTGVGARWRSPIGPVNLDLAFAHQTRKPRLHFSIGYGF